MPTTKFKNEHGFKKNGKFSVSMSLTTDCDLQDAPMVMAAFGCTNPSWHMKDRNVAEKTVGLELQKIVYDTVNNYLNMKAGMQNIIPALPSGEVPRPQRQIRRRSTVKGTPQVTATTTS
jgi:hypothetical protein